MRHHTKRKPDHFKTVNSIVVLIILSLYFVAVRQDRSDAANIPQVDGNVAQASVGAQPGAFENDVDGIPNSCGLKDVDCPGEKPTVKRVINGRVTSYQADPKQTDSDPCHTADGTDICPMPKFGVVANNCLDFGTKVEIRGKVYVVHDRMNRRYGCEVFDVLTNGENITTPKGRSEVIGVYE